MTYDKDKWGPIIKRGDLARKAIVKHIEETKEMSGIIICPNCNWKLSYGKAQLNGHIHASCETKDCVNFME